MREGLEPIRRAPWGIVLALVVVGFVFVVAAGNTVIPARAVDVAWAFAVCGSAGGLAAAAAIWVGGARAPMPTRALLAGLAFAGGTGILGAALLFYNRFGDSSPRVQHDVKVVKKTALGNDSRSYDRSSLRNDVFVGSWIDEGKLIEVKVIGSTTWRELQPGTTITVQAREGKLGWPWVEPYSAK